jgi:hypothetical protein
MHGLRALLTIQISKRLIRYEQHMGWGATGKYTQIHRYIHLYRQKCLPSKGDTFPTLFGAMKAVHRHPEVVPVEAHYGFLGPVEAFMASVTKLNESSAFFAGAPGAPLPPINEKPLGGGAAVLSGITFLDAILVAVIIAGTE